MLQPCVLLSLETLQLQSSVQQQLPALHVLKTNAHALSIGLMDHNHCFIRVQGQVPIHRDNERV